MSEHVIEDGVPIPPRGRAHSGLVESLRVLRPGQSVWLDIKEQWRAANLARAAFGNGNYETRAQRGGYRIWRTK